jgi:hypothetical protein
MVKNGEIAMWWVAIGTLIVLTGCSTVPTSFTPVNPIPAEEFSHKVFGEVLAAHVKDGVVNYPGIQADDRLTAYLAQLDRVDPNALATRSEHLAFWINAYNAFAIKGIMDQYSPMSWMGRYRYFIGREYPVGGQRINLYDLERKILIPDFREPRIHFAIVCASTSCPKLPSRAFTAAELETQLEQGAKAFINDPTKNRFDREGQIAYLSKIFDWFEEDFVAHSGSLLNYVKPYLADPELVRELETAPYAVQFLEYDWGLNGPSPVDALQAG